MRVKTELLNQGTMLDMADGPEALLREFVAPKKFKEAAIGICRLFWNNEFLEYNTITELDKKIMLRFWKEIDGIRLADEDMWLQKATFPEYIRKARADLFKAEFIWIKPGVVDRAHQAGQRNRQIYGGSKNVG